MEACLPLLADAGRDDALMNQFRLLRAEVLIYQGKALDSLAQLDEIPRERLNTGDLATYWMHRGYAQCLLSQFDKAKSQLLRAESLAAGLANPPLLRQVTLIKGTVAARSGDFAEGERLLRFTLNMTDAGRDPFVEAIASSNLGMVYLRRRRYDEALDWFDKAIQMNREIDSRKPGIHLTQVTPTSCSWAHSVLASQSATIERYGVGSTAMACCTRR